MSSLFQVQYQGESTSIVGYGTDCYVVAGSWAEAAARAATFHPEHLKLRIYSIRVLENFIQ